MQTSQRSPGQRRRSRLLLGRATSGCQRPTRLGSGRPVGAVSPPDSLPRDWHSPASSESASRRSGSRDCCSRSFREFRSRWVAPQAQVPHRRPPRCRRLNLVPRPLVPERVRRQVQAPLPRPIRYRPIPRLGCLRAGRSRRVLRPRAVPGTARRTTSSSHIRRTWPQRRRSPLTFRRSSSRRCSQSLRALPSSSRADLPGDSRVADPGPDTLLPCPRNVSCCSTGMGSSTAATSPSHR
jgi:hypothetical protein